VLTWNKSLCYSQVFVVLIIISHTEVNIFDLLLEHFSTGGIMYAHVMDVFHWGSTLCFMCLWFIRGYCGAMPWLRKLVAGLSLWRPGYASRSVLVGFVVDKVTLRGFSPSSLVFPCQYHSIIVLYVHISSRAVVLTYIFPVAALAATVGFRWLLCINHTKKAVKFKYTFKLYQYFLI
jgi:hypothetical protein